MLIGEVVPIVIEGRILGVEPDHVDEQNGANWEYEHTQNTDGVKTNVNSQQCDQRIKTYVIANKSRLDKLSNYKTCDIKSD